MPILPAPSRPIGATVLASLLSVAAFALPAPALAAPGPLPLVVTPSPVNFPATTVAEKSSLEVDVFNEGEEASIEMIAIEGTDASAFSTSNNNCQVVLAEGQHCAVTITFEPGSTGAKEATAWIRFSGGVRTEESFELGGSAVPAHLSFSPSSYDFGIQQVNAGSVSTTFTIENDGEGTTRVNSVFFEENVNGLGFDTNNCNNRLLQPTETCSIQVHFGPNNTGVYANTLRADVAGASFTAGVTGEGVRPEVEFSPNPADFGPATAGSVGATRTITLTNTGVIPTGFFIAVISGGDGGSFQLLDESCTGAELQPTESCSAHIRFAPISAGPKAARLAVFGNNEGGMQIPLLGEGIPAAVTLTPSSYDFGDQVVGSKSAVHSFAVRNDGSTPLELGTASIVGSALDQFVLSGDTCTGATLAAGAQCQAKVRFAPDGTGAKSAVLRVSGDAGPLSASLNGTGTKASVPAKVGFDWRGTTRKLHGGSVLRAGSAKCAGAERCVVAVTAKLKVVRHLRRGKTETEVAKLPQARVRIGADESKPLDLRLPASARKLLDRGHATLRLKAKWTAGEEAGRSDNSAAVR